MASFPTASRSPATEEGFEVTVVAAPGRLGGEGTARPFDASSNYLLEPAANGIWRSMTRHEYLGSARAGRW
jgi:hypothetical protein